MNYFQPNLVDTVYSANTPLMVENHYKNPNGFKRLGNEDLCGTTIDPNNEISIREKFEKTGALNKPVDTDIYIKRTFGDESQDVKLPNHKCIVDSKTGKPFSVMSKTYATQDNEPIYEVFERNKDILDLENICLMNNGSRIFVSGGIRNSDMEVSKDDPIRRRLCFINSYDGSYSFKVVSIDFRLFCFNQMGRINRSKNKLVFKHSKGINDYVKNLPEFISWQREDLANSIEEFKAMKRHIYTKEGSLEILKTLSRQMLADKLIGSVVDKETKEKRAKTFEKDLNKEWNDIKNNFYKETNYFEQSPDLYQIFNALTYQQTHCEQRVKDDIKGARIRMESLLNGKCGSRIDLVKKECLALTR